MVAAMEAAGPSFYSPAQTANAARYLTVPDEDLIADGTLYVAEIDGQLAGVGGWSGRRKLFTGSVGQELLREERLNPATEPARIRAFFVAGQFARRGVARRLYEVCEAAALSAGFRSLTLMATLPGVPLYRALGFEEGRRVEIELPDGTYLPGVEMGKTFSLT
jgi:GNAT superfamily N-acetyltransferase